MGAALLTGVMIVAPVLALVALQRKLPLPSRRLPDLVVTLQVDVSRFQEAIARMGVSAEDAAAGMRRFVKRWEAIGDDPEAMR